MASGDLRDISGCVILVTTRQNAGTTTGSNSTRAGQWTSFPTGPSGGPPRLDVPTPPNPRAIPFKETRSAADPGKAGDPRGAYDAAESRGAEYGKITNVARLDSWLRSANAAPGRAAAGWVQAGLL